jgi:excisionase family DNA binding protein
MVTAMQQTNERFLKLREVEQMLGVSRTTLWRWTVERGLKVVKVGDVTRIRESDLQAFIRRHETGIETEDR